MKVNDYVSWRWTGGVAKGHIVEIHGHRMEIMSKDVRVVREGTADDPALVINHDAGYQVLKLAHEVQPVDG